ncbi:pore-forming ESAT-6 family protein [Streptomyces xiamenensis]|jgi:hypothetical protein|uniref:Uncharacterized protein n=1 Tax=Streptomyces xiamenensis TaxID=408015 RepID=A0A0F7FSE1_9ACTN|nr:MULTISPECIES: pore-forming ESAT-6 family protein [Streptomyces]AKG42960.1 hypothetical protein SXIM_15760 [Streptomyces xiamenensis]
MSGFLDRRSYDSAASAEAELNISTIVGLLETLTTDRTGSVNQAMSNFQADGVSEEYHGLEIDWEQVSVNVRIIVDELRRVLEENDSIAQSTGQRAAAAVAAIRR